MIGNAYASSLSFLSQVYLCAETTEKRDDRYVYTYDPVRKTFDFYEVLRTLGNKAKVRSISTRRTTFGGLGDLPWHKVGAFAFHCPEDGSRWMAHFDGKAIRVNTRTGKYIFAVSYAILRDS